MKRLASVVAMSAFVLSGCEQPTAPAIEDSIEPSFDVTSGGVIAVTSGAPNKMYPDAEGDRVVYVTLEADADNIYLYDFNTGETSFIATYHDRDPTSGRGYIIGRPRVSGDRVVWADTRGPDQSDTNLYLYDLSTGTEVQLTYSGQQEFLPRIDGDHVIFRDNRNFQIGGVYLVDLATGWERLLTNLGSSIGAVDVSDGRVVWSRAVNGDHDVHVYDIGTGVVTPVAEGPLQQISYLIDGDWVIYQESAVYPCWEAGCTSWWAHNLGTGLRQSIPEPISEMALDGGRLAVTRRVGGTDNLFVRELESGAETQVTFNSYWTGQPTITENWVIWRDNPRDPVSNLNYYNLFGQRLAPSNLPPTADAGPDAVVTAGEPAILDGSGSSDPDGTIVSYEWLLEGETVAEGMVATLTLDLGEHTVTLRVTDDQGAVAEDEVEVEVVNADPVADAGADQTLVRPSPEGASVTLDGSASADPDGEIVLYEWLLAGDVIAEGATGTVLLGLGEHTITLRVTDDFGAVGEDEVEVTVLNADPVANAGPDQTTILSLPLTFDGLASQDVDGTLPVFLWSLGDGTEVMNETVVHTYLEAGIYRVTLTVTDNDGASDTDDAVVTVLTPSEATEGVIANLDELVADGTLTEGDARGPRIKLTEAKDHLDAGRSKPAENKLQDFVDQVNALVLSRRIDEESAAELIRVATDIIGVIGT